MNESKPSKAGRKRLTQAIGAGAAILVVAGGIGIPFDILAAIILGAAVVLIADP